MSKRRFSIVVAVLNGKRGISKCIESVARQSEKSVEIVVVDGGSTDGTLEEVRKASGVDIRLISEPDSGIFDAWNKGLSYISGEWTVFLGCDDVLADPDVLATAYRVLSTLPREALIAYGRVQLVDQSGANHIVIGRPWSEQKRLMEIGVTLPHQGVFHRSEVFEEAGGFDLSWGYGSTYEFFLRVSNYRAPTFLPGPVIAKMELGGISTDPMKNGRILTEIVRVRRHYGLSISGLRRSIAKAHMRRMLGRTLGPIVATRILYTIQKRLWRS